MEEILGCLAEVVGELLLDGVFELIGQLIFPRRG
jgi:hypothetical protein